MDSFHEHVGRGDQRRPLLLPHRRVVANPGKEPQRPAMRPAAQDGGEPFDETELAHVPQPRNHLPLPTFLGDKGTICTLQSPDYLIADHHGRGDRAPTDHLTTCYPMPYRILSIAPTSFFAD